jgi:hypothetical protein
MRHRTTKEDRPSMSPIPRLFGLRTFGRLSLLLLACAALYLYAAHNAGRKELRALCEQGVEPKVYRKVSADGYFDGGISCLRNGCWDVLMKSGFRYIEVEQRDGDPWDPLPENGFYRLSKVRQDSGLCDPKILEEMQKAVGLRKYLAGGDCIRLERIDAPTAKYGVFSAHVDNVELDNLFDSNVNVRRFFIEEIDSGSVIAERNNYVLYQNSIPQFSSFATGVVCPDVGVKPKLPNIGNVEAYIRPD